MLYFTPLLCFLHRHIAIALLHIYVFHFLPPHLTYIFSVSQISSVALNLTAPRLAQSYPHQLSTPNEKELLIGTFHTLWIYLYIFNCRMLPPPNYSRRRCNAGDHRHDTVGYRERMAADMSWRRKSKWVLWYTFTYSLTDIMVVNCRSSPTACSLNSCAMNLSPKV